MEESPEGRLSSKELYIFDLQRRFPDYTLKTTLPTADHRLGMIEWFAPDGIRMDSRHLYYDAQFPSYPYELMRTNMMLDPMPIFLLTQEERDSLEYVRGGTLIDNLTAHQLQCWTGLHWASAEDHIGRPAYGEMWQNVPEGTLTLTSGQWVNAQPGVMDRNGIITLVDDHLVVGKNGAGDYEVAFHANLTDEDIKLITAEIHLNGAVVPRLVTTRNSNDVLREEVSTSGYLSLKEGDRVSLHFMVAGGKWQITLYQVNVNMRRISRQPEA